MRLRSADLKQSERIKAKFWSEKTEKNAVNSAFKSVYTINFFLLLERSKQAVKFLLALYVKLLLAY